MDNSGPLIVTDHDDHDHENADMAAGIVASSKNTIDVKVYSGLEASLDYCPIMKRFSETLAIMLNI
ncbi:hypothetical protein HDU76_006235, partial [Blyttiomyces sp. JEL0837]